MDAPLPSTLSSSSATFSPDPSQIPTILLSTLIPALLIFTSTLAYLLWRRNKRDRIRLVSNTSSTSNGPLSPQQRSSSAAGLGARPTTAGSSSSKPSWVWGKARERYKEISGVGTEGTGSTERVRPGTWAWDGASVKETVSPAAAFVLTGESGLRVMMSDHRKERARSFGHEGGGMAYRQEASVRAAFSFTSNSSLALMMLAHIIL
jgi:hypothetical protein